MVEMNTEGSHWGTGKKIDRRKVNRLPDLSEAELKYAEAWAVEHSFAVPQEFLQFTSGTLIVIERNPDPRNIPLTVKAHPVWDGIVSPTNTAMTTAKIYLVPGVYRVDYDQTLLMKYRHERQVGKLSTAHVGGWVMLTAVQATSHRRFAANTKYAYYQHGQRQPEKPYLAVRKYEGEPAKDCLVGAIAG